MYVAPALFVHYFMFGYLLLKYSWIPFAPCFPASIARITVVAPVTASPPANTPAREVCPFSGSATIHLRLLISSPSVVEEISGFGEVPSYMMTVSTSITYSEPGISTGRRLPDASGSPSSIFTTLMPLTQSFSSVRISTGLVRRSKITPSSFAW